MDVRRFFRPDFEELEEYVPVKPLEVLAEEIGVPVGALVKLDANENLYGAPPEVYEAIAQGDPAHLSRPGPNGTARTRSPAMRACRRNRWWAGRARTT